LLVHGVLKGERADTLARELGMNRTTITELRHLIQQNTAHLQSEIHLEDNVVEAEISTNIIVKSVSMSILAMNCFPLLKGCITNGENRVDALEMLDDAKRLWLETALSLGMAIPEPETEKL
jgi:hypothetical protein